MVSTRCLRKVGLRCSTDVFNSETQRACSRNTVFSSNSHLSITLLHGGSRAEIAPVAFFSIRHPLGQRIARGAPPDSLLYHSDVTLISLPALWLTSSEQRCPLMLDTCLHSWIVSSRSVGRPVLLSLLYRKPWAHDTYQAQ